MSAQQKQHSLPENIRRKVAERYRREAKNPKWKKAECAEFNRMADAWEKTLPKRKA